MEHLGNEPSTFHLSQQISQEHPRPPRLIAELRQLLTEQSDFLLRRWGVKQLGASVGEENWGYNPLMRNRSGWG